jgi:hypothetical protein
VPENGNIAARLSHRNAANGKAFFFLVVQITFTEKSRISDVHSLRIRSASGFICRKEIELFSRHVKDFSLKNNLQFFQGKCFVVYFLFFG